MTVSQKEILSAEFSLESLRDYVDTSDIDARLEQVNRELEAFDCEASGEDYAVAVLCGILSGGVDALIQTNNAIALTDLKAFPSQLFSCLKKAYSDKTAARPKTTLHRHVEKGIASDIPGLKALERSGSLIGLIASIVLQLSNSGFVVLKDESLRPCPDKIDKNDVPLLISIAIAVAAIKWFAGISVSESESDSRFTGLNKIRKLAKSTPKLAEIIRCIDKWQTQLAGEMQGHQKATGAGMGAEAIFVSMLGSVAMLPFLKGTNLQEALGYMDRAKQAGVADIPLVKALMQQSVPVVLNEILVRSAYFVTRLARELSVHEDVADVDWRNVVPAGNRTIDRMLTIASMTFTIADTADAAVHAAIESAGNFVLFGCSFVKRFNVVGAGRAAIAVYKEAVAEHDEAELIHELRLLTETKSAMVAEKLGTYRRMLEQRVSEYLAEDISAFLSGFTSMDHGLITGNSDLVIKGNVTIQRILGRKLQFTTQREFDELMDSDIPLKL